MSRIFAVDQSIASCAWCELKDGELTYFGVIKTKKDDGDLYTRCETITTKLFNTWDGTHATLCREGLGFGASNSNASRDLAYLVGAIENQFKSKFFEVPPTSLKKFATGSGKAKKEDMIEALPTDVRDRFLAAGFKKSTGLSDLADAYFIGKYFEEG